MITTRAMPMLRDRAPEVVQGACDLSGLHGSANFFSQVSAKNKNINRPLRDVQSSPPERQIVPLLRKPITATHAPSGVL
jgi:hypothetical protein